MIEQCSRYRRKKSWRIERVGEDGLSYGMKERSNSVVSELLRCQTMLACC